MNKKDIGRVQELLTIEIPSLYLDRLIFLFKDGDEENLTPQNVTYKFSNGPLECPFYPGYYYIPGFSQYVISRDGKLIYVKSGTIRKWNKAIPAKKSIRGGYVKLTLRSDSGCLKGLSRHRAICLTFHDYDIHPSNFVVNHINGVGGDDRIENLEFCTYSENTKHAYDNGLYPNKVVSVDAWNWKTDQKLTFSSIQETANTLELTITLVTGRLSTSNAKRYDDGWRFKRSSEKWLPLEDRGRISERDRAVMARNIESGKVFYFDTMAMAAKLTGIALGSIRSHCEVRAKTPFNGWNFRFAEKSINWPKYNEYQLAIFREFPLKPADGIMVHDTIDGSETFFTSQEKAGKHFGISCITISTLARYGKVWKKRYVFKFVRVREDF